MDRSAGQHRLDLDCWCKDGTVQASLLTDGEKVMSGHVISTASGALVVGGVRDICSSSSIDGWIDPGDRFECSMEYNQSVSGSLW